MKREFGEENQDHCSTMVSKPHHQYNKFHLHSQPSPPHLRHPATAPECPPTSEDADSHTHSHSSKRNATDDSFPPPPSLLFQTNDGATIEVVRRPRGRPPGSKNKPKPPVIITRDSSEPSSMSPYVLEVPPGVDVVESTTRFCRNRNMGLCVLNGSGVVANVTLKQPFSAPIATVTFHGSFDILSISATILPPAGGLPNFGNELFTVSLAGPQGQVVGGFVVGPLVAAGTIYLIAASFNSPSFERLQPEEEEDAAARDGGHDRNESPESGGDVIWAPTARQPQRPQ